jgi:glutaminase
MPHTTSSDAIELDPISAALGNVLSLLRADDRGEVADYIPELSTADPSLAGLALASTNGRLYTAGDADSPFTIQSVSKPFVYAIALADHGLEGVLAHVGAEPSGEAFNAISLEPGTGRPANPMINAGAIVTTSLVIAESPTERFDRILGVLSAFAGRQLDVDERVFESERSTGDRNRALGYLMRSAGSLVSEVDDAVEVYFRQCAVLVTAKDLAVMGATLANNGVNPCTGDVVIDTTVAEQVLTLMATCGMYDFSGEWLLRIGLPAKSGVSGGILAVSPAQYGIGLFSPRLDERGNSVRGVEISRVLATRFALHAMHHTERTAPVVATTSVRADLSVVTVQGDIEFAAAERVLLVLDDVASGEATRPSVIVLDVERVTKCHPVAIALLDAMAARLRARHVSIVVADPLRRHIVPSASNVAASVDAAVAHADQLMHG